MPRKKESLDKQQSYSVFYLDKWGDPPQILKKQQNNF